MEFADHEVLDPASAFRLLSDDIRIAIITELYEAGGIEGRAHLPYAELMDRVDVTNSGKFNYHLTELLGTLVREYEDGYGLKHAGERIYRTIATGLYHGSGTAGPVEVDATCPDCGASLTLRYADDLFSLACGECGVRIAEVPFPLQAAAAYTVTEVLDAIDARLKRNVMPIVFGYCPHCGGPLAGGFVHVSALPIEPTQDRTIAGRWSCGICDSSHLTSIGPHLLFDAQVVGFYQRNGIDVFATHYWELSFGRSDDAITVTSKSPLTADIDLTVEEAGEDATMALALTADGSITVREA